MKSWNMGNSFRITRISAHKTTISAITEEIAAPLEAKNGINIAFKTTFVVAPRQTVIVKYFCRFVGTSICRPVMLLRPMMITKKASILISGIAVIYSVPKNHGTKFAAHPIKPKHNGHARNHTKLKLFETASFMAAVSPLL